MFALSQIEHRYDGQAVLQLDSLEAQQGEHLLVLGLSGSGKTTLLHILGALLRPSAGKVEIAGRDLLSIGAGEIDRFRGSNIGIVFQQMHLLSTLTVKQNLMLARYMAGMPQDGAVADAVLARLDLRDKAGRYPSELSVGEQQRVTLARAVINEPKLILADEPTASLDDVRSAQVLDLLFGQAETCGATLVVATHDKRVKERFERRVELG